MISGYVQPEFDLSAFNCPICGAYSSMQWGEMYSPIHGNEHTPLLRCYCNHCKDSSYWMAEYQTYEEDGVIKQIHTSGKMIFPAASTAPLAHPAMPPEINADYLEACNILAESSRGSAALLRLCVQKLCIHLGEHGKNLNDDIASLVKKGLPTEIQKALDIVRVTGNNAVHPGQLSPDDVAEVASSLFDLVNRIVEEMIARPAELKKLYSKLPSEDRKKIEKRDK